MTLDIAALERATFAAVPPQRLLELPSWLVGLDDGTVGRTHSAVPLRHDAGAVDGIDAVLEAFASAGREPVFRVPAAASLAVVHARLQAAGLRAGKPTLVMSGSCAGLAAVPSRWPVELTGEPGGDWSAVFLGEGFDPVDGASRLAILRRGRSTVFAGVRIDGVLAAVGSACYAEGWCGVHGMRTLPAFRGRGCAGSILAAFGRQALRREIPSVFLQVEQGNEKARALYQRAGLSDAYAYAYWQRR